MANIKRRNRGSANDMLNAFKEQLNDLSQHDIEQSTSVQAAKDDQITYIVSLEDEIRERLSGDVDDIVFHEGDSDLYVTVESEDQVVDFEVPFADLSFDYDNLLTDVDYVITHILDYFEDF